MTKESLLENLSIYNDNLSVYYLGSIFFTILSVLLAWWYHKYNGNNVDIAQKSLEVDYNHQVLGGKSETDQESDKTEREEEVVYKLKVGRQSLITEKIAASLTEEQLKEEKEVERQQLAAIFQLLQNQEDKFQVSSLEELEDQLKLYRH